MPKSVAKFLEGLRAPLLLVILSPLVVSLTRAQMRWDDVFFLHRALCGARAFWGGSLAAADVCLQGMAKSPLMALTLIPAGPPSGDLAQLAVAPFTLALATALALLMLARLSAMARIPAPVAWLAALAAVAAPALRTHGAPFFVDAFFAVIVACLTLVPLVEWEAPTPTWAAQLRRGAALGLLASVGLLTKTTFAVFLLALAPAAFLASWRRSGARATLVKTAAAAAGSAPAAFMFARFGASYWTHATTSAFGVLSSYAGDGRTPLAALAETLGGAWPLLALTAALAVWAVRRRAEPGRLALSLWAAAVIVGYFVAAAISPNKDPSFVYPRFFWPVWLALPFSVAGAVGPAPRAEKPGWSTLASLGIAIALAAPMYGRLDLEALRPSVEALARLPTDHPATVLLATDERGLNIETLLLAQQLASPHYDRLALGTLAYDVLNHPTPDASLARLAAADYVLAHFPVDPSAPEWTNRFVPAFQAALEASGRPMEILTGPRPIRLYGPAPKP